MCMYDKNIVYVHDDNALDILLLSIQSYLSYNDGLNVYVFAANQHISVRQKEYLQDKLDNKVQFRVLKGVELLKEARNLSGLPIETLYRLLLPMNINLPVLYVDYDTFCVAEIKTFVFQSVLSAVPDLGESPHRNERMGLDSPRQFFNAGVLFWRLDLINVGDYINELHEILEKSNYEHDQDILNIMYLDKYYSLGRNLNYSPLMYFRDRILYPRDLAHQIDIRIIHVVGPMKPWLKPFPRRLLRMLPLFEKRNWNRRAFRYFLRFSL